MIEAISDSTNSTKADLAVGRFVVALVLIISIFIVWFSAGDHSLYPPDEGRYGSVSLHMAEGGSLLVPVFEGRVHLTKPPMIYWLQAASIRVLGKTELAVRLPGLAASTFLLLFLFRFTKKTAGVGVALIAVGALAVTPMFVLVSRLSVIDPLLNLFWFSILVFGYQAVNKKDRSTKYTVLMCGALSLGLFAKGPVALVPVGVLIGWFIISGKYSLLKKWIWWLGIPLSFIPLAVWALLVMKVHPDAWQVWKHELLDRAAGSGAHNQPIWYYFPILLAGFFPISALMPIPVWNLKLRYIHSQLKTGSLESLCLLAVILPFLFFSLIPGKLMTYLMPVGPPLAILVAIYLKDILLNVDYPERSAGKRLIRRPISIGMVAVGTTAIAIIAFSAAYQLNHDYLLETIPFFVAAIVAIMVRVMWNRHPERRGVAIFILWIGACGLWICIEETENRILKEVGARQFAHRIEDINPAPDEVTTFGFNDPTLAFYLDREIYEFTSYEDLLGQIDDPASGNFILIVDTHRWDRLSERYSDLVSRFDRIDSALASRNRRVYILRSRG